MLEKVFSHQPKPVALTLFSVQLSLTVHHSPPKRSGVMALRGLPKAWRWSAAPPGAHMGHRVPGSPYPHTSFLGAAPGDLLFINVGSDVWGFDIPLVIKC